MKQSLILSLLAASLAAAGCSSPPSSTDTTSTPTATGTTAATSTPAPVARAADPAKGKTAYDGTCTACHGPDGKGVEGLGKPLVGSAMLGLKDEDLVAFIVKGRPPTDTANTTGIDMPPRGGNPALTDQDIADVVAYMRTLK
ncbi:MAG: hypothetical protein AMXMBFR33_32150 [Candidatus Xenobia bacterium]